MRFKMFFIPLIILFTACGENPHFTGSKYRPLFGEGIPKLTAMPVDAENVIRIGPYIASGSFAHPGVDFTTAETAPFYSCYDGLVTRITINTGNGLPGTNYEIFIQYAEKAEMGYHFEIDGTVSEQERRNNIFVAEGDWITAGQKIANLIFAGEDRHVHFGILEDNDSKYCPVSYFTEELQQQLEALYDSPHVERRGLPGSKDLCE